MEMNTRIQVEHPVTEMVTGFDLVKQQLRVAAGQKLGLRQSDVVIRGHAIECRVNAEDPEADWRPSPGRIERFRPPGGPGVRWDSHLYEGYQVPPHYDSLLAKLIVHADTRKAAMAKMAAALGECHIAGVRTTLAWHRQLFANGFAPSPLAQNAERSRPAERVSGVAPDSLSLPEGALV